MDGYRLAGVWHDACCAHTAIQCREVGCLWHGDIRYEGRDAEVGMQDHGGQDQGSGSQDLGPQ